jgi:hypothetical protein
MCLAVTFMQKTLSTLYIIFAAFLFSSLVYLIVGFTLSRSHWKPVLSSGALRETIFWILLAVSAALSVVALKFKTNTFSRFPPLAENAEQARSYLVSKCIVMYAIAEVPAIFGLVYFMLSGSLTGELILCLISIAMFFFLRPTECSEEKRSSELP